MRTSSFMAMALLLPALAARAQQDGKEFNYYGDDQQKPPQPQLQPPQQPVRPIATPVAPPPQDRYEDWRRVHGLNGQQPPPVRPEVRPQSAPGQVWIAGFWMPSGPQHVWVPGHYAYPPAAGYVWEPARWQFQNDAWVFYEGHWYTTAPPQPQVPYMPPAPSMVDEFSDQPPPPPMGEYQPPVPFGNAVWIPGYWHWNGMRFGWVAGRWSANPPGFYWQPHKWVRSADGRFREEPGHWHR
jgi:hypothetical protein